MSYFLYNTNLNQYLNAQKKNADHKVETYLLLFTS